MELSLEHGKLRPWRADDAASLARHANDREVWRNMRDAFPHPYTLEDARRFLDFVERMPALRFFAIEHGGEAVGGIGISPLEDVYRRSGEIGYWLARPL